MRESELKNKSGGKKIVVDDITPDLSLIPSKDKELYISLLEIEMYEHFKNRRKRKPRDQPENKKIS